MAEPKPVLTQRPVAESKPAIVEIKPPVKAVEQTPVAGSKPLAEPKPVVAVTTPQKEPAPVAVAAVCASKEQVSAPASAGTTLQTLAESVAQSAEHIDAKLSEYYGVSQMQDAVVFVTLYPRAETVAIAGDFNNWQPATTPMQRVGETGVWQAKMKLPHGTYRYRLVVDGQWQQDPYNERSELNPYGEYNSILEVK
ncbi:MAG: hypothetical protein NTZ17_11715 [Phycisphaerae bacterium]|nr:hypothetical protein [Phycisphaerae bacterium]